jgi:hypothetical protein
MASIKSDQVVLCISTKERCEKKGYVFIGDLDMETLSSLKGTPFEMCADNPHDSRIAYLSHLFHKKFFKC